MINIMTETCILVVFLHSCIMYSILTVMEYNIDIYNALRVVLYVYISQIALHYSVLMSLGILL